MRLQEVVNSHKSTLLYTVLAVFCLISLGVSEQTSEVSPARVIARTVVGLQEGIYKVGDFFRSTVASVRELGRLREEFAELLDRVRMLEESQGDLQALKQENEALREALTFHRALTIANLPARVIGKEPGNLFTTLTIDKGSRDGVEVNQPVVAMDGDTTGLVGKVAEVLPGSALVLPIIDPAVYVAARLDATRYEGLVRGNGQRNHTLVMRYVDRQARFGAQTGGRIVTSGLRSLYPAGLEIGRIVAIQARPYETSLEIEVRPTVDFSRIEYVFVLITQENE